MLELENKMDPRAAFHSKMDRLLRPRSIALVGASTTPGSLGQCVLANLESAVFEGELHLVNPKRPVIRGQQCLGSIDELPPGIECAVLAIRASAVVDAVRACARKDVRSVIIYSAGFGESGEEGRAAQRELARIAREQSMIVQGPNCLGLVNYLDGIPLTFIVTPPQVRSVSPGAAIISQSGALTAVIAVNMRHHAIPLTYSISTGNEAVSGLEDFVEHLIPDTSTRVFALVVEQFRQPKRFLELARRARAAGKFIVLLHPGRSNPARISAATHTGAIAGDYDVMHTHVTHAGVIHVESMEELVDVAQLLIRCNEIPSEGAAILTESGAFKALALDLCDRIGLELPSLSEETERALRQALPVFIPASNPLDLTAQALVDPDLYRRTLLPILKDHRFGSVLLAIILTDPATTRLKLTPIVDAIRTLKPDKPVIFTALDEGAPFDFPALDELRSLGVACFPSPERAMRALAYVTRHSECSPEHDTGWSRDFEVPRLPAGIHSEAKSKQILSQIGISIPPGRLAKSPEEATIIAAEIGFPVALKAQAAALSHKSEAGGVLLGIDSGAVLLHGWENLHRNVAKARPGLALDGVLVERMSGKGLELIVGARNDPEWGPVLLVGFGGVLAEAVNDVRLLPPHLSREAIKNELTQLRCGKLLQSFRGQPPRDITVVADVIARIGHLMLLSPEIQEIDINPLIVYGIGYGAVAVDALISVAETDRQAPEKKGEVR